MPLTRRNPSGRNWVRTTGDRPGDLPVLKHPSSVTLVDSAPTTRSASGSKKGRPVAVGARRSRRRQGSPPAGSMIAPAAGAVTRSRGSPDNRCTCSPSHRQDGRLLITQQLWLRAATASARMGAQDRRYPGVVGADAGGPASGAAEWCGPAPRWARRRSFPFRVRVHSVYAGTGSSGDDGDLASCIAGYQVAHGLWHPVQRVGPVDARRQLAAFDEFGEPFQIGGALLAHDAGEPLAHEQ
jgi:hypothetical protein